MAAIQLFKCDLGSEASGAVEQALRSGQLAAGPHVAALEDELSAFLGGRSVAAISDMTHALSLALQLAGVGAGDEVLTLSYNCLSSNAAICAIGAVPVWVDVEPDSARMSVADAQLRVTPRTKALVVYHVAGYPADLAALRALCDARGLALIEDANNAIGARIGDTLVGTVGDFAVFSFYANRQINAIEGAALVCRDDAAARAARKLRRFGIDGPRFRDADGEIDPACDMPIIGVSAAMTNINALLARGGLVTLTQRLARTRHNVALLERLLDGLPGLHPVPRTTGTEASFWAWLVLCERRDDLLRALKGLEVQCSKLHQPNHVYSGFGSQQQALPGTDALMAQIIALPCGWWLDDDSIMRIAAAIRASINAAPAS